MSLIIPKKPQILYAPMLGSLGGGSARGFGRGVGGGPVTPGEARFTTLGDYPSTYSWVVPDNVTLVSLVAIGGGGGDNSGGGGGGGGALGWKNNLSVTPGASFSVHVGNRSTSTANGGDSYLNFFGTYIGAQGGDGPSGQTGGNGGGVFNVDGGGAGGDGGTGTRGGGGGAGGYSGAGGRGGGRSAQIAGYNGSGGGAGGGYAGGQDGGGGGGTGIFGEGSSGLGATTYVTHSNTYGAGGGGGSGGGDGAGAGGAQPSGNGSYGGGAGSGSNRGSDAHGAVRIIWGDGRAFPSTNVAANFSEIVYINNSLQP
jgi:hypothetical protein